MNPPKEDFKPQFKEELKHMASFLKKAIDQTVNGCADPLFDLQYLDSNSKRKDLLNALATMAKFNSQDTSSYGIDIREGTEKVNSISLGRLFFLLTDMMILLSKETLSQSPETHRLYLSQIRRLLKY